MKDKHLIDHRHITKNSDLDKAFNNIAGNFVEILNDAIAKEQAKPRY